MAGSKTEPHEPHGQRPSSSSRLLSLFLVLLPLALILPAFILSAVSTTQKNWSYRELYDPTADDIVYIGTEHRTPFLSCILSPKTVTVNGTAEGDPNTPDDGTGEEVTTTETVVWDEVCYRVNTPDGLCDSSAADSSKSSSAYFCQHLSLSARLLYGGCALLGVALTAVLMLTATAVPQVWKTGAIRIISSPWPRRKLKNGAHQAGGARWARPSNHALSAYLALLLTLVSALGALALFMGTVIGANALSVIQFPNGDFFSTGISGASDPRIYNRSGPWMLGASVGACAASAILAGVASYTVGLVWEGPRVGVLETHYSHSHEHNGETGNEGVK